MEAGTKRAHEGVVVGIDLGTSNCAVAFADPARGVQAAITDFPITQVRRAGEIAALPLLPSFIYLFAADEFPPGAVHLPWSNSPARVVGEFARWQGARVPSRMVASAKSWLAHPAVDRSATILPWGAPADIPKVSPVTASAEYLRHIAAAWNHVHPATPLREQQVVLTVPASFDEVARAFTVQAAREAGLEKFTLLEEPEAAFYDFIGRHRSDIAAVLKGVRLVLVIDVGGGTTDLTLVHVSTTKDGPRLERIAVGEHLMLGGDNMDAALARHVEERLSTGGRRLSPVQWMQLLQSGREAKERLLSAEAPDEMPIAVAGEGSRLFGSTLSTRVTREEVQRLVVDGFFPTSLPDEIARRSARAALQELGLPYAHDPAITRHVADFLRKHAAAAWVALGGGQRTELPRPDAILFNGGVFNGQTLAARIVDVLSGWWPECPRIDVLPHSSLDLAVARGATYYALVRHGLGLRISGGAAHALFVGLGSPDLHAPPQAICVIPRGHEEGEMVELRDRPFQLALGKPVQFPLYSTAADRADRAGAVVPVADDLQPLVPIHTVLQGSSTGAAPVFLRATLTEIGTLDLSCVSTTTNQQWRLEFELRGGSRDATIVTTEWMPARFSDARQAVEFIFSARAKPAKPTLAPGVLPKDVRQLWSSLERMLGPRAHWSLSLLRELWTSLLAGAARRRRSADHERVYFQLLGYCLRPGFGYSLDDWRCAESFHLFEQAVEFHKEKPNWTEFWILWRRIAPGLNEAQHRRIHGFCEPHFAGRLAAGSQKNVVRPKGVQPEGFDEMIKMVASLEELSVDEKIRFGEGLRRRLNDAVSAAGGPWAWAMGRLGARVPVRGSSHRVVPPEIAGQWIEDLLSVDWRKVGGASFAVAQVARLSGDRARDIPEATRERVVCALRAAKAPETWVRPLIEVTSLEKVDQARLMGDSLPVGLQIHG